MGTYVELSHVKTWYDERGEGEPLVLLHGGVVDARFFDQNIEPLAARFRVFALDLRGHGHTPDVDGPLTYASLAQDTIEFLDAVIGGPAHLVGHSVGASDFKRLADCEPIIVGRILLDALPRLLTAADIRVAVTASGTSEGLRLRGSLIRSRSRIRVCTPRAHLALEVVLAWGSLFHAIQVDRVNR